MDFGSQDRIMIVDDEEFCLSAFKVMLKKANIDINNVDFCIDGFEALNMLKHSYQKGQKYKLILTDFNMPKLNGIDSCVKMRSYLNRTLQLDSR